uniref:Uncharacterized protein n=1 Tax=Romanomermis culicivorax TaxID=13658 RepID=A0A915KGB3_ROMCU
MTEAGLTNYKGSCSFHQWEQLRTVLLPDYQIKIFSKELFKDLIFRGHLCFMQPVGSEQIEEEDVFETNYEGVNNGNMSGLPWVHVFSFQHQCAGGRMRHKVGKEE